MRSPVAVAGLALAGAGTAVYLGNLAANGAAIVSQSTWDADTVGPMVLAEALHGATAPGRVWLDNHGNQVALVYDLLTQPLPGHRAAFLLLVPVASLLTVALLAWSQWRAGGARAAILATALFLCASPVLVQALIAQTYHGLALLATALCAAFVVAAARLRAPSRVLLLGGAVAVWTGVNAGSDPLVLVTAVAPLGLAGLYAWRASGAARGVPLLATAVAAAGVDALTVAATRLLGVKLAVGLLSIFGLAGGAAGGSRAGRLLLNGRLLLEGALQLAQGYAPGEDLRLAPLAVLGALLVVAAAAVVAASARRLAGRRGDNEPAGEREVTVFWLGSAAVLVAAFLVSSQPADTGAARYLVTLPLALAALAGLAARVPSAALAAGGAVVLLGVMGAVEVDRTVATGAFSILPATEGQPRLLAALRERGLDYGYAPYFDAAPLTWNSEGAVTVRPALTTPPCDRAACIHPTWAMTAWYQGDHPGPSFVVLDPYFPILQASTRTPTVARFTVGRFTVLVFASDAAGIASG